MAGRGSDEVGRRSDSGAPDGEEAERETAAEAAGEVIVPQGAVGAEVFLTARAVRRFRLPALVRAGRHAANGSRRVLRSMPDVPGVAPGRQPFDVDGAAERARIEERARFEHVGVEVPDAREADAPDARELVTGAA
jgi:hypothetical protein